MKQILIRDGQAAVEDVPVPTPADGEVLVRAAHSCISVGTEMSGVQASSDPLWKRALKRPDKVIKALNMMMNQGVDETMNVVRGQLNAGLVVGYSAAGRVLALGHGVTDLEIGQAVACAGAQAAHHAEIIRVPRNLVVPVPDGVTTEDACTVTLGAIAMQGVRRAQPTLGETFVVLGLGLLGQLTVQLLRANGCRAIGLDLDAERTALALELGMDLSISPEEEVPVGRVAALTGGVGADGVIVTAASPNPDLLGSAFRLCRRKGRVVLVGDIPIQIDRADIYRNEIDFFISTSYGPGRYDRSYEEEGLDYPTSYVRWTENRNMSAYLALVAEDKVQPARLVESIYTVDRADEAYQALKRDPSQGARPLALLLAYPDGEDSGPQESESARTRVRNATGLSAEGTERIQVGLAGAGAFARSVHLPNMSAMKDRYFLRAVMSRTAHLAQTTAKTQRAEYATTDYEDLLKDDKISLLLIASRHDTHGDYVLRGLKAGKHVFVEKPLCLTVTELADIEAFYADAGDDVPVLMTGFNRRFAPGVRPLVSALKERSGPMMVDYRMNAGHIPLDNWVHGAQGGGRNLGEACHIYDLFTALVGARCISVKAHAIRPQPGHLAKNDNFVATLRYDDGSICTLTYTALGASGWAKERLDVFCDGKVYALDDYKQLQSTTSLEWSGSVDKGHKAELNELADCLLGAGQWPIALWEQVQATSIALQVEEAIHADSYP